METKYLLYLQIGLIVLLFYFGSITEIMASGFLTIIFATGIVLGLWAYYNMGSKVYSPFPEPRRGGKIIQEGAYKLIRHPMYTGIILVTLALFLTSLEFTTFLIFAVLLYVLDSKATTEEALLSKMHPQYKTYAEKTKKFIPFFY